MRQLSNNEIRTKANDLRISLEEYLQDTKLEDEVSYLKGSDLDKIERMVISNLQENKLIFSDFKLSYSLTINFFLIGLLFGNSILHWQYLLPLILLNLVILYCMYRNNQIRKQ